MCVDAFSEEVRLARNKLFLENTNSTGEKVQKKRKNLRINQQNFRVFIWLYNILYVQMLSNLPQLCIPPKKQKETRNDFQKFMA